MSTLLTIPDAAELLAHTLTALKAAGYASAAMMPVYKNTSDEVEKTEAQPPPRQKSMWRPANSMPMHRKHWRIWCAN